MWCFHALKFIILCLSCIQSWGWNRGGCEISWVTLTTWDSVTSVVQGGKGCQQGIWSINSDRGVHYAQDEEWDINHPAHYWGCRHWCFLVLPGWRHCNGCLRQTPATGGLVRTAPFLNLSINNWYMSITVHWKSQFAAVLPVLLLKRVLLNHPPSLKQSYTGVLKTTWISLIWWFFWNVALDSVGSPLKHTQRFNCILTKCHEGHALIGWLLRCWTWQCSGHFINCFTCLTAKFLWLKPAHLKANLVTNLKDREFLGPI